MTKRSPIVTLSVKDLIAGLLGAGLILEDLLKAALRSA